MSFPTIKLLGVDFNSIIFSHLKEKLEKEFSNEKDLAVQITPTEADNVEKLYDMAFSKFKNEHTDEIAGLIGDNLHDFNELCELEGRHYAVEKFELEAFDKHLDNLASREHAGNRSKLLLGLLHLSKKHDRRMIALEPDTNGSASGLLLAKDGSLCGFSLTSESYGKKTSELKRDHIIGKLHNLAKDPLTKGRLTVLLDNDYAFDIAEELKQLGWFSLGD